MQKSFSYSYECYKIHPNVEYQTCLLRAACNAALFTNSKEDTSNSYKNIFHRQNVGITKIIILLPKIFCWMKNTRTSHIIVPCHKITSVGVRHGCIKIIGHVLKSIP